MRKQNYFTSETEISADLPEFFGLISSRFDLISIKAVVKKDPQCSHCRVSAFYSVNVNKSNSNL